MCLHTYLYFLYSSFLKDFKFKFNLFLCVNHISHINFFIISIFFLTIFIIIFSLISLGIDIVLINSFDISRLSDYNRILSNLSGDEAKDLIKDILSNKDVYYANRSNCFFNKLNGIPVPQGLLTYNFPYTNSFVNDNPQIRFADPRMVEFCRLYDAKTNYIREQIIYDFFLYHNEAAFFSESYPNQSVALFLKLKGITRNNLEYFSGPQLFEIHRSHVNYVKNSFFNHFDH